MKFKFVLTIASVFLFVSCGTISTKAPIYKSADNTSDASCLIYVYRVKNFVGGVAPFEVRTAVYDDKTNDFVNLPGVLKLYQLGYIPITLKSNTLYRITIGTNAHTAFYFGPNQAITLIKVDGPKIQYESVKNTSYYMSHTVSMVSNVFNNLYGPVGALMMMKSQKNLGNVEKKALTDAGFKELEPNTNSEMYKELQNMRLSK